MNCIVCEKEFDSCKDEDVCSTCKKIASEKTIDYFRKKRFEKTSGGKP